MKAANYPRWAYGEILPAHWRYFDLGGSYVERYSVWQGDGYLFSGDDPQGCSGHGTGDNPDAFSAADLRRAIGEEITFDDLPEKVQQLVAWDAAGLSPEN